MQGAKKIIFTACHSGQLKLAFTSPDVISTSPKTFLTGRIDFIWRKIAVANGKPEKNLGLQGIWTLDLCNTGSITHQQANWEQVIELVGDKPVNGWWWNYEYVKII